MKILLGLLLVYVLVLAWVYLFQRSFIYFPPPSYVPPERAGANPHLEEISLRTADGISLKNWYAKRHGKALVVVFFHGNGDSLPSASPLADPFIAQGYGFVLAEYRGYGGMPGSPTEQGLYEDARAAIRRVLAEGVAESDLVLMGHSLGSAVAVQMATEFRAAGLVLLSPFWSLARMGQIRFPFLPAERLVRDRFESFAKIARIGMPLLSIHGDADLIVPPGEGQRLFEAAREPKTLRLLPAARHNDLFDHGAAEIMLAWLESLRR